MKKVLSESKGKLTIANKDGDVESNLTPKENLKALLEAYKVQNPDKYEIKKEALEKQLKNL